MLAKYGYSQKDYDKKKEIVEKLDCQNQNSKHNEGEKIQINIDESKMSELEKEIEFYQRHPFLTPFVGSEYEKAKVKILVVMESHYLPEGSKFYDKYNEKWLENWYKDVDYSWDNLQNKGLEITKEDIKYIWTERVVRENLVSNAYFQNLFKKFLEPIYYTIIKKDDEKNVDDKVILETVNHIAFMNYFLRPSETTGRGICVETRDKKESFDNIKKVYDCLNPDLIVICSNLAGRKFNSSVNNTTGHRFKRDENYIWLYHPSNQSWGRIWKDKDSSRKWTSKEFFIDKLNQMIREKESN